MVGADPEPDEDGMVELELHAVPDAEADSDPLFGDRPPVPTPGEVVNVEDDEG